MKELNPSMLSQVAGAGETQEIYNIHTISLSGPFRYEEVMGAVVVAAGVAGPVLGGLAGAAISQGSNAKPLAAVGMTAIGAVAGFFIGMPIIAGGAKMGLGYMKYIYDAVA